MDTSDVSLEFGVFFARLPQYRDRCFAPPAVQMRNRGQLVRGPLLLCLLCIVWFVDCFPNYGENEGEPWYERKDSGETLDYESSRNEHPSKFNKTTRACTGPSNEQGRCEHFRTCFLKESLSTFTLLSKYNCTIDETYVGVCCPHRPDGMRTSSPREENLADILPVIVVDNNNNSCNDEDNNHDHSYNHNHNHDHHHYHHYDNDKESITESSMTNGGSKIVAVQDGKDYSDDTKRNPPKTRGCGTTSKSKTRLVGARPADPSEWPWMAALLRQDSTQYCGGVLITDRHILTAAHCVYRYKPRDIRVRLGEYDFTSSFESRAQDFAVSEIRVHGDFDYTSYENDIAIVKIHRPTIFDSYVWPICLPPIEQSFENRTAVVTGWGTQYYGGPASTVLMEVAIPIWPQYKCVNSFVQRISPKTMCAGAYEGGRDACQGDSGGPLLHQLGNGRWVNVGIVSWGIRCGEPGHPGIYTRVNSYLDWIFANAVF